MTQNEMEARLMKLEAELKAEKAKNAGKKKDEKQKGQNCDMVVKGNVLTITVDLGANLGQSSTGKSQIVATTGGNVEVVGTDGIKIGLNIYKPVAEKSGKTA